MQYLKSFKVFEQDIPGDPVGISNINFRSLRTPDTMPIKNNNNNNEWRDKKKTRKRKSRKNNDI